MYVFTANYVIINHLKHTKNRYKALLYMYQHIILLGLLFLYMIYIYTTLA
jgi:hypothetical protein